MQRNAEAMGIVPKGQKLPPPESQPTPEEEPPAPPVKEPGAGPRRGPQRLAGKEGAASSEPAPPPTPPAPRSGPRRLGGSAATTGTPTSGPTSQEAKTSTGKVKIGADIKALAEELGSSMYKGKAHHVVTKELTQNALDAIRGVKGGEVTIDLDSEKNTITVSDTGKGMNRKDLETVFVDLGASGKRSDASASGGFGLAKAAPLMMSDNIHVETVSDEGGKRYRHTMDTNKEELLGEGATIHTQEVSRLTPTGTKVTSTMPDNGYWAMREAKGFAKNTLRSVNSPGKINIIYDGKSIIGDSYELSGLDLEERKHSKKAGTLEVPGAKVDIYTTAGKKGLQQKLGSVPVEINNNGIYQFQTSVWMPDSASMKGLPTVISADVKATVPEGHQDYPFTTNREEMRGDFDKKLRQWVRVNIADPAMKSANDFISKKYSSLPVIGGQFKSVLFDSGARLEPHELKALQGNKDFVELTEDISQVIDDTMATLAEQGRVLKGGLEGLGSDIERAGIVFSKDLHGVHIQNTATGKATVFINPFSSIAEGSTPRETASVAWHTIKHEILHDKVKGHNQNLHLIPDQSGRGCRGDIFGRR